jgi:hypothetical protein
MGLFGRKKERPVVLEAGKPLYAGDVKDVNKVVKEIMREEVMDEQEEKLAEDAGIPTMTTYKEPYKEPLRSVEQRKPVQEPHKFTPEEIVLDLDWKEYTKRCSGIFNPQEIASITIAQKDALMLDLLFSIWRELKELRLLAVQDDQE